MSSFASNRATDDGLLDSEELGINVGDGDGDTLGEIPVDGIPLGDSVGLADGLAEGNALGTSDGDKLGLSDGLAVGKTLGLVLGLSLGCFVGASVLSQHAM